MQSYPSGSNPEAGAHQNVYASVGAATVTAATTKVSPLVKFDQNYAKTQSGVLKIACMLCTLVGYICVQASGMGYRAGTAMTFYSVVAMIGFWVTFILFAFYCFHIVEHTPNFRWLYIVSNSRELTSDS